MLCVEIFDPVLLNTSIWNQRSATTMPFDRGQKIVVSHGQALCFLMLLSSAMQNYRIQLKNYLKQLIYEK